MEGNLIHGLGITVKNIHIYDFKQRIAQGKPQ